MTVGGRTSAVVEQVQKLPKGSTSNEKAGSRAGKLPKAEGVGAEEPESSELSDLSDAPGVVEHAKETKASVKRGKRKVEGGHDQAEETPKVQCVRCRSC